MARHRENVRFLEVNDEKELQDIDKREQIEVIERQEEI